VRAKKFTPADRDLVERFHCGDSDSAAAMAGWITGDGCLESIRRGTEVWLFLSDDGRLIGFGSLGVTCWPWPSPADRKERVSIIPALAVSSEFQGRREVADGDTYALRILKFLIQKAKHLGPAWLVLYVAKKNAAALKLYARLGFVCLPDSYKGNRKLFLDLADESPETP